MSAPARPVVVLGASGVVGTAVLAVLARTPGLGPTTAFARNPFTPEVPARVSLGDRRSAADLARAVDAPAAWIDLCAFDDDAVRAVDVAMAAGMPAPTHVVYASALAERPYRRWRSPLPVATDEELSAAERDALDDYGRGKRDAAHAWRRLGVCPVSTLLLGHLVTVEPARAREAAYVAMALRDGIVRVAGTGQQRIAVTDVRDVAHAIVALVADPPSTHESFQLCAPEAPPVVAQVAALLRGAGLAEVPIAPHPTQEWRGPHGGGDEIPDCAALRERLPGLTWRSAITSYEELGAGIRAGLDANTVRF